MGKIYFFVATILCIFLAGCQDSDNTQMFTIQPKTSGDYTSISYGSNGPAFQLLTITNTTSSILNINNISFTIPNSSITLAKRSKALNQNDSLYGILPQCATQMSANTVNALQPGQTCGILLQGFTYDPREALQTGALTVSVSSGINGLSIQKTYNLTDTTHVYVNPTSNTIGSVSVPANDFVLADCSNSTSSSYQPLTCTNALGSNNSDNFLSHSLGEIRVFPNGNLILGGEIKQAGSAQVEESGVFICQPGSSQCQNALGNGAQFTTLDVQNSVAPGFISEIELDSSGMNNIIPNSTFFVTGKFDKIINANGATIAQGTGTPGYFIAYCTIGGACTNIMPGESTSNTNGGSGDLGIYGLAYNNLTNTIYFAGTFSNFSGVTTPGGVNNPIVTCTFNGTQCSSYGSYFYPNDNENARGPIYGLSSVDRNNELEVNGSYAGISSQSAPNAPSICMQGGNCQSGSANALTFRGAYDPHANLFYIPTYGNSIETANSTDHSGNGGKFLAACSVNNIHECFDVLGGGINGTFNNGIYPIGNLVNNSVIGNVGAQLSVTEE